MASTCCCSGGPDRGNALSPGMSRPPMRTDTIPQPPYWAVSRATTGPPGRVEKVSRICPPDSAGQLNAPSGNLVRLFTNAATLATVAGSVTVKARSRRLARGSGLRPKTGVTVSTLAAGGTRSATGRAGSQTTWASTRIAVWLPDRTASTTSSRWISTPGTAGSANMSVHDPDPVPVPVLVPVPTGVKPGGRWARIQASTSCGRPGTRHHRVTLARSGVTGRAPDWLRDEIGPVRTAPGDRGNDAMMRAASAPARCRGLADAVVRELAVPVPVRAPPGCGPNGWLPQPDRTTVAYATAHSRPGSRSGGDGRTGPRLTSPRRSGSPRSGPRRSGPRRMVMPL